MEVGGATKAVTDDSSGAERCYGINTHWQFNLDAETLSLGSRLLRTDNDGIWLSQLLCATNNGEAEWRADLDSSTCRVWIPFPQLYSRRSRC